MGIPTAGHELSKVLRVVRITGESSSVALVSPALRTRALALYVTAEGFNSCKLIFNSSLSLSDLET